MVMMSISERQRQTLESIENGLVRSAPKLASMLAIAAALLTLTVILGHGTGRAACMATRVAATCHHVPGPARPVANRTGGS